METEKKGFVTYLRAGYPAIFVQTHEECRAISALAKEAPGYKIYSWDILSGLKDHTTGKEVGTKQKVDGSYELKDMDSKDQAVKAIKEPLKILGIPSLMAVDSILFLKDFHKFVANLEIFRTIKNIVPTLKANGKHIVFVSPSMTIPVELEKEIHIYPFSLPVLEDFMKIAKKMVIENNLNGVEINPDTISACKGMTLAEAENAMALSLVQEKKFSKKILEKEKLQVIRKSGLMELYEPVPISQLGGLGRIKKYALNRLRGFTDPKLPFPKGIILVGLPGGGKTLTGKVFASIFDCPLIRLDFSGLKAGIVGESERKLRDALALIDAVGKSVVLLDEVEKALGGAQSSNRTDGGTTAAMVGYLLNWMQESKGDHYIIATCNEIEVLLQISQGAFLRRFDDIFFVDVPSESERKEILAIMNKRYDAKHDLKLAIKMQNWTGAEIEKFVVASLYDGADEAFLNVKPIFEQNQEVIGKARSWAKYNARLANDEPEPEKMETKTETERRIK